MPLPFPYGAKHVAGWEPFQEYHRFLIRNFFVFGLLFIAMPLVAKAPEPMHTVAIHLLPAVMVAWVVFSFYFVTSNSRRHWKLLCPQCKQKVFGIFRNPNKCRHCGIELWAPLTSANRPGVR